MKYNQRKQAEKINILNVFFALFGIGLLITISTLVSFNNQVYAADLEPGEVRLTKTAKPVADMVNQWDVTVKVEGRDHFPPPATDIILVIDMSNSMVPSTTSIPPRTKDRLALAKEAAKKFANQVLKDGYNNQMSLVTFESEVIVHKFNLGSSTEKEFIDPSNRQLLLDRIDSLTIDLEASKTDPYKGGTFTQGAIREATNQLVKSSAINRDIVLISDGVPTFNYDIKAPYNQKDHMEQLLNKQPATYNYYATKQGIPEEFYDYSKRIGEGKNYTSKAPDSWGTPAATDRIMTNSANAALDEAGFTKAKKATNSTTEPLVTDLYAIGIDLHEEGDEFEQVGQQTLKGIASSDDNYFDTTSDDLDDVLSGIGGKLIGLIKNADIIDPMGKGFKLTDKTKIQTTQGDVETRVVNGIETINWSFDALITPISNKENEDIMYAEMTYRIDATNDVIQEIDASNGLAPTNGKTTIEYVIYSEKNSYKEQTITNEFVVPKVRPTIVSVEKKVTDGQGNELKTKNEEFEFSIGNDTYTEKDLFNLYATDSYEIVHLWEANKNYSIDETLTASQEYLTNITINKQETTGTSARFMFTYDSDSSTYPHQKIKVTNQKIEKILHIRQAVIEANEELVVPKKGYYFAIDENNNSQKLNFISGSTIKNTVSEIDKTLFTTYKIELEKKQTIVSLSDVVPEYYQLYGYILTKSPTNIANEHVSSNDSELKTENKVLLDYKVEDEYWVTMFIKPKFNSLEKTPRPYSWSYRTNQFGK